MKNTNGALVAGVERNGPADKGGLEAGDVITKFDGSRVLPLPIATRCSRIYQAREKIAGRRNFTQRQCQKHSI